MEASRQVQAPSLMERGGMYSISHTLSGGTSSMPSDKSTIFIARPCMQLTSSAAKDFFVVSAHVKFVDHRSYLEEYHCRLVTHMFPLQSGPKQRLLGMLPYCMPKSNLLPGLSRPSRLR